MKAIKRVLITMGAFLGISASAWAADLTVTVAEPNGVDDTAVVQAALDQCVVHGPGCTVQLAAGTYLTRQLFAKDYHGAFKGKGIDVTIIQALPNLPVNQEKPFSKYPPGLSNPYPMFILFYEGEITVSDMTIRVPEMNAVAGWWYGESDTDQQLWLWSNLEFMGESTMNVVVTRVALEGRYDESLPGFDHYNSSAGVNFDSFPPIGASFPGQLPGTFLVSASRMKSVDQGIAATLLRGARLTIGGSPSQGNIAKDCEMGAWLIDLDESIVDFSHNDISVIGQNGNACVFIIQGPIVETPGSFLVQHNNFKATGGYEDGIWLFDEGPINGLGKKIDAVISDNTITLIPGELPTWAGVEAEFVDGAVISNNRIVGSSTLGISLEGASQSMVRDNNLQKLNTLWAPVGLLGDSLGFPDTTGCTVVGFGSKTNVYDEGVNNILVGVNNMEGNSPGSAISDAMKLKREMIKSIRKP